MKGFILGLSLLIILNIPSVTQCAELRDEMRKIEGFKREMESLRMRLEEEKGKREEIEKIVKEIVDIIEKEGKERAKAEVFKIVERLKGIERDEWKTATIKIEELNKIEEELVKIGKRIEDVEKLNKELANERMKMKESVQLKEQEIEKVKQEVVKLTRILEEEGKRRGEVEKADKAEIKTLRERIAFITEELEEKGKDATPLIKELEEERRKREEAKKEVEKARLEVASLTKRFEGEIKDAKKEISELSKRLEVYEKEGVEKGVKENLKKAEKEIDKVRTELAEEKKRREKTEKEIDRVRAELAEERKRSEKAEREKEKAIEIAKKIPRERRIKPEPREDERKIKPEPREDVVPKAPSFEGGIVLSPGDRIRIVVKGHEDLTTDVTVSKEGVITFPLIGEIQVSRLTVERLEEIIAYRLGKDYIVNPQVTVTREAEIDERPRISVCILGGVRRPGLYPYHRDMTIMHAIAMAGGVTERAILNKVKVVRGEEERQEVIWVNYDRFVSRGDERENILLRPDDLIVIPESPF